MDSLCLDRKYRKEVIIQVHSRVMSKGNVITLERSFVIHNTILESYEVEGDIFQVGHAG